MHVIRLDNGNLRVPHSALHKPSGEAPGVWGSTPRGGTSEDGQILGEGYVEIGPDNPDYSRLADQAVTEEEMAAKRRRWRDDDEDLLRQFEEWKAQQESAQGE